VDFKDYYASLGVDRSADEKQIRRAYRKLARRYHPDVSKEPEAESRFREINEAYEVLKDPDKRAKYDRFGARWRQAETTQGPRPEWQDMHADFGQEQADGGGFGNGSGFSAFFDMLFGREAGGARWQWTGGEGGSPGPGIGTDVEALLKLTLEEAARGGVRTLSMTDPATGAEHTLRARIPAGVRPGQRIRLAGKGSQGVGGGRKGDLFLVAEVRPHAGLRLDGKDLHTTVCLSPAQAALGAAVSIETLGGPVRVRIPPGSSSGRKVRLRGKGFPVTGSPPGDLYVEIKIVVSATLSPRERELYEELDRLAARSAAVA